MAVFANRYSLLGACIAVGGGEISLKSWRAANTTFLVRIFLLSFRVTSLVWEGWLVHRLAP